MDRGQQDSLRVTLADWSTRGSRDPPSHLSRYSSTCLDIYITCHFTLHQSFYSHQDHLRFGIGSPLVCSRHHQQSSDSTAVKHESNTAVHAQPVHTPFKMADEELGLPRSLPDEVFSMICEEIGLDRDFGSLYRCALASRSFADPALRTMYKSVFRHPNLPLPLTDRAGIMKSRLAFCKAMNLILA
jgi:hypothetical protein